MSVLRRIQEAAIKFEMVQGKAPTKLYLGHLTKAEVREELHRFAYWIESDGRGRIYGMELYEVDAEDHLAVSV